LKTSPLDQLTSIERQPSRIMRERRRLFWWFTSPWVIGLLVFTLFPLGLSLVLSFTQFDFSQAPIFVGFLNYVELLTNSIFLKSVMLTIVYTLVFVPVVFAISMALAFLLDGNSILKRFTKLAVYSPTTITSVVVGWLWLWILNPTYGILNSLLRAVGLPQPQWLINPVWLMVGIILLSIWASAGSNMIVFLAALQNVPKDVVEASQLDGANAWTRFRRIVFPLLAPVSIFVLINTIIASIQIFTPIYIMTGGGPNYNSEFYVLDLYQTAFQSFNFGSAAAMSWLMLIVMGGLTIWFFSYLSRHSYESSQ
jgi:multiple sugar transport system permease protein